MPQLYKSKYYNDLSYFLDYGWSEREINIYFPLLESLNVQDLLQLHQLCQIIMFSTPDSFDKEQAIHVLVNHTDTPKDLLIKSLQTMKNNTF
jgi:hypothetical protein